MAVEHHVPEVRLGKRYFRRWWYWKGVSRARMDSLHPITELGVDLRQVPHWARVPRYMFTALPSLVLTWLHALVRGRWTAAARDEMLLCYTIGYIRARWARTSAAAPNWPAGASKREARQSRSVALRMLE
jgi:hypothetical protein